MFRSGPQRRRKLFLTATAWELTEIKKGPSVEDLMMIAYARKYMIFHNASVSNRLLRDSRRSTKSELPNGSNCLLVKQLDLDHQILKKSFESNVQINSKSLSPAPKISPL